VLEQLCQMDTHNCEDNCYTDRFNDLKRFGDSSGCVDGASIKKT
jgi:hypothetical protein